MKNFRLKYRIDFNKHQWFILNRNELKESLAEIKKDDNFAEVFKIIEYLDQYGNVTQSYDTKVNEKEL